MDAATRFGEIVYSFDERCRLTVSGVRFSKEAPTTGGTKKSDRGGATRAATMVGGRARKIIGKGRRRKWPFIALSAVMTRALIAHNGSFRAWGFDEYAESVINGYPDTSDATPFAVVGDFNGDGTKDIVLHGHDERNEILLALMSEGRRFVVIDIEKSLLRTDPAIPEHGYGEPGLRRYLISIGEPGLTGFEFVFENAATFRLLYRDGKFQAERLE